MMLMMIMRMMIMMVMMMIIIIIIITVFPWINWIDVHGAKFDKSWSGRCNDLNSGKARCKCLSQDALILL